MEARKFTNGDNLRKVFSISNSLQTIHKLKETRDSQL